MLLNAMVLGADVQKSEGFFDQGTGMRKPSYMVVLSVIDMDTKEKYDCQLTNGFPRLDDLKELSRKGEPDDVIEQVMAELRAELPQVTTFLTLEVVKFKGKSAAFIKLVCRFPQGAMAQAAA